MEVYNTQPATIDIRLTQGDTFNIVFRVTMNKAPYLLTNKIINIMIKNLDGSMVKVLSSSLPDPAIVINDDSYVIDTTGFPLPGTLKYDVQVTEAADILTIQKGRIIIEGEITTTI